MGALGRFFGTALLVVVTAAATARADDNDLVLSRLSTMVGVDGKPVPENQAFRSLASQLGVVIAPHFLTSSDTLGYSGFQFSTELSSTTIDGGAGYWCATEGTASCAPGLDQGQGKSGSIPTVGVMVRKGIWLPAPSFEMGGGVVHVGSSRLWAGQLYSKVALHEGFHDWPVPSVALRGAVSRLFGDEQLDLTVASFDVSISKRFAIAGTFSITPYLGWNYLWIIPRSQVIDATPSVAVKDTPADLVNNFVFPTENNVTRSRWFIGFKLKYYVFAFTAEADFAGAGSSTYTADGATMTCDAAPAAMQGTCIAADKSGSQTTLSFSASLDF